MTHNKGGKIMTEEEWLEFFKNYYGYEFNISLEQKTKNEIKYKTEMGLFLYQMMNFVLNIKQKWD